MTRIRRAIVATLLLLIVLLSSGCWNRRELNTLGIVGLVGVDACEQGITTTFGIIIPEKSGKSSVGKTEAPPAKYVQASGKTIMDTVRDTSLRFDRKLFLSQAKAFLFSEEIARNGLGEYLDGILRYPEMRLSMHLIIVKDTSAADVMGVASGINIIPSAYMEDIIKQYKVHSTSIDSRVLDFLKASTNNGINPVVTVFKKIKKNKIGEKGMLDEYELTAEGVAVFSKDKLVGFLDGQETRGYNWVIGNVHGATITFPTPGSNAITSVEVFNAESNNDVDITGKEIKLKVNIRMNGMLDEQTSSVNLQDIDSIIESVEQGTSQAIKQEVEHTLLKVQKEYQSDIFGFGQIVHRKYPDKWKTMQDHWNELFSQAIIEVVVQAKVTKTGKSSYPVVK
ncbi:MAG: Germination protein, Ger(X)C family [Firmicutes bacterium]|nr:Germination protein, Ger(X)C family [Bacillota bacterium]